MSNPQAIRLATEADAIQWNRFAEAQTGASIAHLFEWKKVFERAYGRQTHNLCVFADRECVALLPFVHMRGRLGGNRLVSLPYLDQGGILASESADRSLLQEACLSLAQRLKVRGLDFRGSSPFDRSGNLPTSRFRFLLELGDSRESLWNVIGPKVRNQIRKSEREGLSTRRVGVDQLGDFHRIMARNMHRLGSPVHGLRFFESIASELRNRFSLYLTFDETGNTVAGGVALRFKSTVTVPWASSLPEARSSCPNHSLYWRVLQDALESGSKIFDFGRSSQGTGTFHFKKQWRAQTVPLQWTSVDTSGNPVTEEYLDPRQNAGLARMWSLMPGLLADRLGPVIRGRLSN